MVAASALVGHPGTDELMKYVFLDIVGFSYERPTEAQADIIQDLNRTVTKALDQHKVADDQVVKLPTGDGMCIALRSHGLSYDIHLQLATMLLAMLTERNGSIIDEPHRFEVRIGIHEETDITYIDINGNTNVAGAGINMTQRIMSRGDGGHILLSRRVYDTVENRERYRREEFRFFPARVKHEVPLTIYQLIREDCPGLNLELPSSELARQDEEQRLAEVARVVRELVGRLAW